MGINLFLSVNANLMHIKLLHNHCVLLKLMYITFSLVWMQI